MEGAEEGIERVVDSKDMQQQTKAFDKLTDRVEDRQLDSSRVQEVLFTLSLSCFLLIAFQIENSSEARLSASQNHVLKVKSNAL